MLSSSLFIIWKPHSKGQPGSAYLPNFRLKEKSWISVSGQRSHTNRLSSSPDIVFAMHPSRARCSSWLWVQPQWDQGNISFPFKWCSFGWKHLPALDLIQLLWRREQGRCQGERSVVNLGGQLWAYSQKLPSASSHWRLLPQWAQSGQQVEVPLKSPPGHPQSGVAEPHPEAGTNVYLSSSSDLMAFVLHIHIPDFGTLLSEKRCGNLIAVRKPVKISGSCFPVLLKEWHYMIIGSISVPQVWRGIDTERNTGCTHSGEGRRWSRVCGSPMDWEDCRWSESPAKFSILIREEIGDNRKFRAWTLSSEFSSHIGDLFPCHGFSLGKWRGFNNLEFRKPGWGHDSPKVMQLL